MILFGIMEKTDHGYKSQLVKENAVNPNFRTTLLSGICTPKMVLKRDADEKKKKIVFGKV